jgi:hypothetical protein
MNPKTLENGADRLSPNVVKELPLPRRAQFASTSRGKPEMSHNGK